MPPPPARVDALSGLGNDLDRPLTSEEIDAMTTEAVRAERLGKRPKFLDKVFEDPEGGGSEVTPF